jgi:hypothetical protein
MLEDEDYVYFFLREQAVEYINCGKVSARQHSKSDRETRNSRKANDRPAGTNADIREDYLNYDFLS